MVKIFMGEKNGCKLHVYVSRQHSETHHCLKKRGEWKYNAGSEYVQGTLHTCRNYHNEITLYY
jgi:hypothetical protein